MCKIEEASVCNLVSIIWMLPRTDTRFWDSKQVWICWKKLLPWPALILRIALNQESLLSMVLKNSSYPTPTFLMDVIVDTSHDSNFYDIAIYVPYCIVWHNKILYLWHDTDLDHVIWYDTILHHISFTVIFKYK